MIQKDAIAACAQDIKNYAGSSRIRDILSALDIRVTVKDAQSPLLHGDFAFLSFRNGRYHVLLSSSCPEVMRPFVLAHEVGHAILHKHSFEPHFGIHHRPTREEDEADYFALKLLDVRFDFGEYKDSTIEQTAFDLGISQRATELLYEEWIETK